VNCDGTGAIQFISCNTVTIVGVIWDRCGNSSKPGIEFSNSSNVTLQTSSFCNSTGQTIVLSNVIGIVYINNCQFSQNDHYQKHGAALYYSKGIKDNLHLKLTIRNCTFSHNTAAGLVYMNSIGKQNNYVNFENSVFSYNQAVPVYICYNTLRLKGDMVFEHNVATNGGAIFSSNSLIVFEDNHQFKFYNNSAIVNGGSVFSVIEFRSVLLSLTIIVQN